MTDKGLNLFDDCAAEVYIYLCPQEEECTPSSRGYSKIYTPDAIANLRRGRALTKINKNGAAARSRILLELGILYH